MRESDIRAEFDSPTSAAAFVSWLNEGHPQVVLPHRVINHVAFSVDYDYDRASIQEAWDEVDEKVKILGGATSTWITEAAKYPLKTT